MPDLSPEGNIIFIKVIYIYPTRNTKISKRGLRKLLQIIPSIWEGCGAIGTLFSFGVNIGKIALESNSISRKVEDAYILKYFLMCIDQMC